MAAAYETIRSCLVDEFEVAPALVTPDAALASLALDSLALVELSLVVEERLGVTVADITPDRTLGELAARVDASLADPDAKLAAPNHTAPNHTAPNHMTESVS
ncbi:acyl carrier protein [Kitasatospora sp. NPDC051170]|uniref:acyl carrier protein n=1 Tax=Kitasatospora sp. NPDC051170 TaxID=3364056 RepID=UPI00379D27DE